MKINLSEEDFEFLKELQNELNTQEHDGQADPRYWVVAQYKKEYGNDDCCDGSLVCDCDGEEWDTVDKLKEFLIENDFISSLELEDLDDFEEILEKLDNNNFRIVSYTEDYNSIVPNTMFLTKRSCKAHIESNHYHYARPHTYAMTAWRNPEMDRLLKILTEMKFCE